jgi:predicted lipoprotein with Yx(FWY)xxD motif
MRRLCAPAIALLVLLTGAISVAWSEGPPAPLKQTQAGTLGTIVTAPNGLTLYTFANDEPGRSKCNGPCAETWPPFRPDANAPAPQAPLGTITRGDGSKQYTYKDKPLYFYAQDKKPGDTIGQAVRDAWFVVQP